MSNLIQPHLVPSSIQEFAEYNVKKALAIGAEKLNIHIPFEGVRFFQKSKTAGYVFPMSNSIVYLNLELLKQNQEDFEKDTIPHEVAHLFARKFQIKNNLTPEGAHGKTWKMVMKKVYGLEPTRCHHMDTTGVGRKVSKYRYICRCKKHEISCRIHNRIKSGKIYACRKCKSSLTFLYKCD